MALDPCAAQIANLLVANPAETGLLEVTRRAATPFRRRTQSSLVRRGFAVEIAGSRISAGRPAIVRPGEELKIGPSQCGCRMWLAISGGVEVPAVLGSRSTDLRCGFGGYNGRALRDGDELSLGKATALAPDPRGSRRGAHRQNGPRPRCALRSCASCAARNGQGLSEGRATHFWKQRSQSARRRTGWGCAWRARSFRERANGRCSRKRSPRDGAGGKRWAADSPARGLPNNRRLPEDCSCDHGRSPASGTAPAQRYCPL